MRHWAPSPETGPRTRQARMHVVSFPGSRGPDHPEFLPTVHGGSEHDDGKQDSSHGDRNTDGNAAALERE